MKHEAINRRNILVRVENRGWIVEDASYVFEHVYESFAEFENEYELGIDEKQISFFR